MKSSIRTIPIAASQQYDVLIGEGLLDEAGMRIRDLQGVRRAVIVSDDQVFPLYGLNITAQLTAAGISCDTFVFAHGEHSKSLAVYGELLEMLCAAHLTRSDLLIALGGGVVGDLTGFAAATYQRGIRFVQIPTTLLAAVDSSVGGKTAVNLKSGKNQVGCFYQPSLVLCDPETLSTLPEEEYRNGCAEVIKYAMIQGSIHPGTEGTLFRNLEEKPVRQWLSEVIARCVELKRDVVMRDEFDTGERMYLNFGHTLAHGIEACSQFTVPHGLAVAMGMAEITCSAQQKGICPSGTWERLVNLLEQYHLPVHTGYPAAELAEAALSDKKNTGDRIRIIVPEEIGICSIRTIASAELIHWIHPA